MEVILNIAEEIKYSPRLNERHLHHLFSHLLQEKLQEKNSLVNLLTEEDINAIRLHPEWPTYKTQQPAWPSRGRYKKGKPNEEGKEGHVDFAIGEYGEPDIGVEFSLKEGWSSKEVRFDFLKLLDNRNKINASISFNVVLRKKRLVPGGHKENLERRMKDAYDGAVNRLNNLMDKSRKFVFIVTEINKNNKRHHWYRDRKSEKFEEVVPGNLEKKLKKSSGLGA